MANTHELENAMPVAPLKIVALPSAEKFARKVNDYLVAFRRTINNDKVKSDPAFHGYIESSFLTNVECPRFGTGESKAVFHESIRGKDLFIITDVCIDGNIIGEHQGIVNFTVGQRKGLGMTFGKPMFVLKLDNNNNTVTLGDNKDLFSSTVYSKNNFFAATGSGIMPEQFDGMQVEAKIRYAARPAAAVIRQIDSDTVEAVFIEPQRAATPGQSIVFYHKDMVIGGGFIE